MRQIVVATLRRAAVTGVGAGEHPITTVTIHRTLAAAITSVTATTCTLDAATGLPSGPFLIAFASGECARVRTRSGASVTAMDRGWGGTTPATQTNGSAAVITTVTPDLSQGAAQVVSATAHVTLLDPINIPGPMQWIYDVEQDSTGGWSTLASGNYVGMGDGSTGDTQHWDTSPSTRYAVPLRTRADGSTVPTGIGGSYPLI